MGVDTVIYIDNNYFEKDINYTIGKLCKFLNKELFIYGEFNNWQTPKDDKYFCVCVDDFNSLEEKFKNEYSLELYIGKLELMFSEKNIFLFDINWDFGRWREFADFLKETADEELIKHYQEQLRKIKFCSKFFGSTKMILFNDQDHQDIEDKLDEGMSIEEVLLDKRWRIITERGVTDEDNNDDMSLWSSNYIYYEEWDNNDDFDIELWKKEYLVAENIK